MSTQRNNHTQLNREAIALVRAVSREGSLRRAQRAACVRIDQELTILDAVTRLGYLQERHIAEATGIEKGLRRTIEGLCEQNYLRPVPVEGYDPMYWPTMAGFRAVGSISLPGIGVLDLANMPAKMVGQLARVAVSDPGSMNHLTRCADANARLDRCFSGVVLGERVLLPAERMLGRFGTFSTGHRPDAVVISPAGAVTIVEVECSPHDAREDKAACGALKGSTHIEWGLYLAYGRDVYMDVLRRVKRTKVADLVTVVECRDGELPPVSRIVPAGVSRRASRSRVARNGHKVRARGISRASRRSAVA